MPTSYSGEINELPVEGEQIELGKAYSIEDLVKKEKFTIGYQRRNDINLPSGSPMLDRTIVQIVVDDAQRLNVGKYMHGFSGNVTKNCSEKIPVIGNGSKTKCYIEDGDMLFFTDSILGNNKEIVGTFLVTSEGKRAILVEELAESHKELAQKIHAARQAEKIATPSVSS